MANIGNMYGPDFTFLGIPRCDLEDEASYKGADVVILGAPIDSGTTYRSGTKMGPQAIRGTDYLSHGSERPHLNMRVDGLKDLKIFDAGDVLIPPNNLEDSLKRLEKATEKLARAGVIPIVLGGDHSIASADVSLICGVAVKYGRRRDLSVLEDELGGVDLGYRSDGRLDDVRGCDDVDGAGDGGCRCHHRGAQCDGRQW